MRTLSFFIKTIHSEHFCDWKINVEVQACNNEPKSERDITPPPTVPDFPSDIY